MAGLLHPEMTLDVLRAYAVSRSLFEPSTLSRAVERLGFVQADPIRAPARAQDLILRPRVAGYRAGDLERRYPELELEEEFYVNYGFVPRALQALMHPRKSWWPWGPLRVRRTKAVLAFVRERGTVHPREVDAHFAHGSVQTWGGTSSATTHLLNAMHYRGLLRVVRRESGVRLYAVRAPSAGPISPGVRRARLDTLIDTIVGTYAPLPALSLNALLARMRYATPQWKGELRPAIARAKARLSHAHVEGVTWYWPAGELPAHGSAAPDGVRLLAPFDPVVWDRRRFELLWGWPYRFEAYTPPQKRRLGYYALPMLWRDRVLGWANLSLRDGALISEIGYVAGRAPRARAFKHELEAELARMRAFLRA
jgi:uncharacterized protein YcaQ